MSVTTITPAQSYPVQADLDAPLEVPRWLPLVTWILAVPHALLLTVYSIGALVASVVGFFSILFTGRVPPGIFLFIARVTRYSWRVTTYFAFMRQPYPSFSLVGDGTDPGDDPARFEIVEATELNRWAPLYKWVLAIPHFVVLWLIGIGISIALLIGFLAALFTGRWPESVRAFLVNGYRWQFRVFAYLLLRDEYPPFELA